MEFVDLIISWFGNFQGELAALSGAFLWASCSIAFGFLGVTLPPLQLNFLKGAIAIFFIGIAIIIQGKIPELQSIGVSLFLVSGILGIGIGDTAFFKALNNLGARRVLLMETLAPPMTALLGIFFLGERLSFGAWNGILLTLIGVAWVISERTAVSQGVKNFKEGILWSLLAAFCQAGGVVISRFALLESNINPLWSTLFRLVGGTIIIIILLLIKVEPLQKISLSFKFVSIIIITAFGGTFLGILLQQTALKFTEAGIAQTLFATSPLFVLPIAAGLGEKISMRSIIGVLIAVGGIALLFLAK